MQENSKLERLSNGLPVVFEHMDGMVAATYWWVNVGSLMENKTEAGFAHFLEHMLFKDAGAKDTGQPSTGKMARAIEGAGGDINAYTSFEQTVYHVTCAEKHWEKVLDQFGMMAKPQKFLKNDFDREREVILEELKRSKDSPDRKLFESLFTGTFGKHPYGRPVIGFERIIKNAKLKDLESFYKNHYVADQMGLIMVGPVADESRRKGLLKKLEKYYGIIPASKPKKAKAKSPPKRPAYPAYKTPDVRVNHFSVSSPSFALSFRCPSIHHEDLPALDVVSGIMGVGESSRLYNELFREKSLVTEVSTGIFAPREAGMFYAHAEAQDPSKLEAAFDAMIAEFQKFHKEGPTQEEVDRVIASEEAEKVYARQTADGSASRLGFLHFSVGDRAFDHEYLERLKAVTAAKVKEVVSKYFRKDNASISILLPEGQKIDSKRMANSLKEFVGSTAPEKKSSKQTRSNLVMPLETWTTSKGIRFSHFYRPSTGVFSVHSSLLAGVRLEPKEQAGLNYILAQTWTGGTRQKNARAIAREVESCAASMDGFSGRNSMGLDVSGLSKDWNRLTDLFQEVLTEPTFPEDETDHALRIALENIRSLQDRSAQLSSRLFMESLYETHPYGRPVYGTEETLANLNPEQLKSFHRRRVRPDQIVISVSGSVRPEEVREFSERLDARMESFESSDVSTVEEEQDLKAPRWVRKDLGREQKHIILGGLGTTMRSKDRYALRLLQSLLSGQGGRLFVELREKKSLAYSVAPIGFEGIERGFLGTYVACSPEKRDEAVKGIEEVYERLAKKGPTPSETERAKEYFLGRRSMELQSDSSLASHAGLETLYGFDPRKDDFEKSIRAVTPSQIQKVCKKYFVEPPMVTSEVG